MEPPRVPQPNCTHRKISRARYGAGMRLLASAVFSAMSLSQLVDSEALPSSPHALPHGATCGLGGGHVLPGCGGTAAPAVRGQGMLKRHAFPSLRGGGFSWGAPEQQRQTPFRRGASGLFGAAWGGGNPQGGGTNNGGNDSGGNGSTERRQRVDTRGPPDLNARLPATAPGSAGGDAEGGGGGGYFGAIGGGGGGAAARERVRTVGPPDGGGGGGSRRRARRGLFAGSAPTAPPVEQQQQPVAGGRFVGGRADPFWTGAMPRVAFGGRTAAVSGDDGEGDGPSRGWGKGGVSDTSDGGGGLMAVHYLVLSCFALFSLNTLFGVDRLFALSLNHQRPRWWQSVTSLLLHGDQHHLMGNMFNLVIFGKMAEEDMGPIGMLASFVACGVASSFVSLTIMPRTISSCGASGAIFGLYSVCVLGRMFNLGRRGSVDGRLRKLIEAAVFGWFVAESVMSEMRMVVAGGVTGIDHAAHFGGVFAGAVLILMFRRTMRDQSNRERNLRDRRA